MFKAISVSTRWRLSRLGRTCKSTSHENLGISWENFLLIFIHFYSSLQRPRIREHAREHKIFDENFWWFLQYSTYKLLSSVEWHNELTPVRRGHRNAVILSYRTCEENNKNAGISTYWESLRSSPTRESRLLRRTWTRQSFEKLKSDGSDNYIHNEATRLKLSYITTNAW